MSIFPDSLEINNINIALRLCNDIEKELQFAIIKIKLITRDFRMSTPTSILASFEQSKIENSAKTGTEIEASKMYAVRTPRLIFQTNSTINVKMIKIKRLFESILLSIELLTKKSQSEKGFTTSRKSMSLRNLPKCYCPHCSHQF